jgi:hypothetical protein
MNIAPQSEPAGTEDSPIRRKAISKRIRYEILRRDDHTCRYCGLKAGQTELTVDHVVPVALGGTDDPSNLVAACKDCNAGKTSTAPDSVLVEQASEDALRWSAAMQVAAGKMRDDFQAEWDYADALDIEWSKWKYGYSDYPIPRPSDWRNSASAWRSAGLPVDLMVDAARRALGNKKVDPSSTWKYFCGIAWKRITQIQEAAKASLVEPDDGDANCSGHPECDCEALAYDQGRMDAADRLHLRYSHLQFQALMDVTDAEGIAWLMARR